MTSLFMTCRCSLTGGRRAAEETLPAAPPPASTGPYKGVGPTQQAQLAHLSVGQYVPPPIKEEKVGAATQHTSQ